MLYNAQRIKRRYDDNDEIEDVDLCNGWSWLLNEPSLPIVLIWLDLEKASNAYKLYKSYSALTIFFLSGFLS
jgi:hypothetical protein